MEYIKSEEANEDLLFREEVMRQFEYFYQYMHGDRKEPNEVETIFKRSTETLIEDAEMQHRQNDGNRQFVEESLSLLKTLNQYGRKPQKNMLCSYPRRAKT
jgi:hypothetical protein